MKYSVVILGFFITAQSFATPVQSLSCDGSVNWVGRMKSGKFTYTANPLKMAITIGQTETIITDSNTNCLGHDPEVYTVTEETSNDGWKTISLKSPISGLNPDGGYVSTRDGMGRAGCPDFVELYSQIELSNCVEK